MKKSRKLLFTGKAPACLDNGGKIDLSTLSRILAFDENSYLAEMFLAGNVKGLHFGGEGEIRTTGEISGIENGDLGEGIKISSEGFKFLIEEFKEGYFEFAFNLEPDADLYGISELPLAFGLVTLPTDLQTEITEKLRSQNLIDTSLSYECCTMESIHDVVIPILKEKYFEAVLAWELELDLEINNR